MNDTTHAIWAPSHANEREFALERRQTIVRRRMGWALCFSIFGPFLLPCFGVFVTGSARLWGTVAGAAMVTAMGGEWVRRTATDARRRSAWQRALKEEFESAKGWTVEMTVYQGAAPTGEDRGVVWFEGETLYFVGRRTSFRLVAGRWRALRQARPLAGVRSALTLDLSDDLAVGFDIVAPGEPRAIVQEQLAWGLRRWLTRSGPGGGQYPPLSDGADAPSAGRLLGRALGATAFWSLVGGGWACALAAGFWTVGPIAVLFLGPLLGFPILALALNAPEVWAPRTRWRAWRDQCRLERRGAQ